MKLSSREIEVKDLMLQGYTNLQIANILKISMHTVKTHISNVYQKSGVNCRMELAWKEICMLRKQIEILK